jgi:Ni/Fe-hydrogenase 1 B-type cytochrome subunit
MPAGIVRTYVWQIPVRVTHWLIAGSIVVLSVTGLYIGHPFMTTSGEARLSFVMGWMKLIHLYSALVFIAAVVARIVWMFTGNKYARWDKFIPVHKSRQHGILPTIRFYLFALRKPPGFVGHNPIAGMTYTLVFGLYFLAILTGLTLWAPYANVASPVRWFASLAPLSAAFRLPAGFITSSCGSCWASPCTTCCSGWLMSVIEANGTMESIFSGYKFVPPEDLEYSGYRFINRKGRSMVTACPCSSSVWATCCSATTASARQRSRGCATSTTTRRMCMSWTAGRSASPCFRMWRRQRP